MVAGNNTVDFTIKVDRVSNTGTSKTIAGTNAWDNCTYPYTGDWFTKPYTYHYDWGFYPKTIYKYQIICPRCKRTNWAEIDQVIVCTCKARLKAVIDEVDYEIAIKQ